MPRSAAGHDSALGPPRSTPGRPRRAGAAPRATSDSPTPQRGTSLFPESCRGAAPPCCWPEKNFGPGPEFFFQILFELDFVVKLGRHTQHDAKHTIARTAPHPGTAPAAPPPPRLVGKRRGEWEWEWEQPEERRRETRREVEVVHHAARRFSLSGTVPPFSVDSMRL